MTTTAVDAIERTSQKTREWVNDLAADLGTEDTRKAWRVMRAYLQTLRDRLTIDEAAQLAAQFPHLVRGVYYEGFDPGHQPERIRHPDAFLALFAERAQLDDPAEAPRAVAAGTRLLARHISAGELEDVFAQLPQELRDLLTSG
jgi:uncharacterized protein (DUF2267 family)